MPKPVLPHDHHMCVSQNLGAPPGNFLLVSFLKLQQGPPPIWVLVKIKPPGIGPQVLVLVPSRASHFGLPYFWTSHKHFHFSRMSSPFWSLCFPLANFDPPFDTWVLYPAVCPGLLRHVLEGGLERINGCALADSAYGGNHVHLHKGSKQTQSQTRVKMALGQRESVTGNILNLI